MQARPCVQTQAGGRHWGAVQAPAGILLKAGCPDHGRDYAQGKGGALGGRIWGDRVAVTGGA